MPFDRKINLAFLCAACILGLLTLPCQASEVRFERDVMAVLSKSGCNLGTCHGNLHGKGDLRLSLRGQDPHSDYFALTHDLAGRRVRRVAPTKSLILLKATAQVPHQGGQRFKIGSPEYQILLNWIESGATGPNFESESLDRIEVSPRREFVFAPATSVQLNVQAHFSDGSRRDVTRMATYEPANLEASVSTDGVVSQSSIGETTIAVRYLSQQHSVQLAFLPPFVESDSTPRLAANFIDEHVLDKLSALQLRQSETVGDSTFLRRAYFDLLGIPPTANEAIAFADDRDSNKRNRWIDRLLGRPEFADQWALKWSDLLRNEEKMLDRRGVQVFHEWIRQCFVDAVPLDEFVKQLVASRGSTYENPPANFYRPLRDPLTRGETAARLFLGVRLQCAKCHNHPFDHWTQDDYYSWAGVFARVDYELVENKRRDKFDKQEFVGEQRVIMKSEGEVRNARTGDDSIPRFLGSTDAEIDTSHDRLQQLAAWLTDPSNEAFAKAQVNRIWYHLMGQGLVDPVDDFRITNPASHPELLEALAMEFIEHDYDVRYLIRTIMNSKTYQVASRGEGASELAERNYGRTAVRRLTAEQILDSQSQFLQTPSDFNGYDRGTRAGQLSGVQRVRLREKSPSDDDRFLTVFGKPARIMACECERSDETTLSQAFLLISGEGLNRRLQASVRLQELSDSDASPSSIVEELYWSALSRPPTLIEMEACILQFTREANRLQVIQDIAWALLNSKEFMFRH